MRLKSLYLVVAAISLVTACANDATSPARVQGIYRLNRVNGSNLPFLAETTDSSKLEILGGAMVLDASGTWSAEVTSRLTAGTGTTPASQRANGTFSLDGDRVTFIGTDGESFSGLLSGDRVTAGYDGITFEFVKQ